MPFPLGVEPALRRFLLPVWELAPQSIPGEVVESLERFLDNHEREFIPITVAIQACLCWLDLAPHDDWMIEGLLKKYGKANQPTDVPAFIIYYPHYLRFHEVWNLAFYTHPMRFVRECYSRDLDRDEGFEVFETRVNWLDFLIKLVPTLMSAQIGVA